VKEFDLMAESLLEVPLKHFDLLEEQLLEVPLKHFDLLLKVLLKEFGLVDSLSVVHLEHFLKVVEVRLANSNIEE
jgi:hypothetical protein